MSSEYSLERADRITVGTSDVTMRIWKLAQAAGEAGLTRDEIIADVAQHVNAGYAKRRYFVRRQQMERYNADARGTANRRASTWEDTDLEDARGYVIGKTLRDMVRREMLTRDGDRYRAGRRPRYTRDERAIDLTGQLTRLHMNGNEALRVLEPALARHKEMPQSKLTAREWVALERLVGLYREAMRAGFPTVG